MSDIHYFIGNACSTFTATVGIDDEVAPNGSVIFQVWGDGVKLYDSGILNGTSAPKSVSISVAGKNDLELMVVDDGNGLDYDHSDWAGAQITCSTAPATTITNVQATGITSSAATITWTTNNLADSQVDYGTTTAYGSSTSLNSSLVTSHSQQITGLTASNTYHYRVKSRDSGGTLVTSPDGSFNTAAAGGTSTYLSDMTWTSMTNGWGPAEKDMSNGEQGTGDGHTISIRGVTYAKGLGVHAASDITYNVGGTCSTFLSDIGIDDEVAPNGSVVFQVWGDGTKLYDSGLVNGTMAAQAVWVDISGKQQLELMVTDGGNGIDYDHSDWAGARIQCGSASPPPTVKIASPLSTLTYKVGDVINYSGSATDSAGNPIPAGSLAWQIIIHHCPGGTCHTHFFLNTTGSSGSFTVPDHGDNSYFEIDLTATDSAGLSNTAAVSIQPQTVQLTLASSPSGLQVVYGGTSYTAAATFTTIVNSAHTIQVVSPQGSNVFSSWSDGGAQQHNITIGATNLTITANFTSAAPLSVVAVSPAQNATNVAVTTAVTATFSVPLNPSTLTSQTMTLIRSGTTTPVTAKITLDSTGKIATLTPSSALQFNAVYNAKIRGGANGVKDTNGNAMTADYSWSFTTAKRH